MHGSFAGCWSAGQEHAKYFDLGTFVAWSVLIKTGRVFRSIWITFRPAKALQLLQEPKLHPDACHLSKVVIQSSRICAICFPVQPSAQRTTLSTLSVVA
jgi:hypothetical protein